MIHVRNATVEDLELLIKFTAEEAKEAENFLEKLETIEEGIKVALEDESVARYWVLVDETNRMILGSISALKEWSDWNARYYWWIQSMYILPEFRGNGYSKILLDAVKCEMEKQNGLELRLYVHENNTAAIRAYEKAGFVHSQYKMMIQRDSSDICYY